MAEEHGKGAIQSPPDERDIVIDEERAASAARLAGATAAATLPTFRIGNLPPVTNQGSTPQCVVYSSGSDQNWQDRIEHNRFFDWNASKWFYAIGGSSRGAVMRYALDYRSKIGIPENDASPSNALHRIQAYAQVVKSVSAIKNAIAALGGVLVIGPWYDNWTDGLGSRAILPRPSGGSSGHAFWAIGWDEYGMLCQNSWGTGWGDNGRFRMPWAYVVTNMWEVWSTVDQKTVSTITRGRINARGVNIRFLGRVTGSDAQMKGSKWGETVWRGIKRSSDGRIVDSPWNKSFRFGGWVRGLRHGIEPYPDQWGKLYIFGRWRAVARPRMRLV